MRLKNRIIVIASSILFFLHLITIWAQSKHDGFLVPSFLMLMLVKTRYDVFDHLCNIKLWLCQQVCFFCFEQRVMQQLVKIEKIIIFAKSRMWFGVWIRSWEKAYEAVWFEEAMNNYIAHFCMWIKWFVVERPKYSFESNWLVDLV